MSSSRSPRTAPRKQTSMGFSLQELWHRRTESTSLAASNSGNSFTNFPVNQETKHPRSAPRSPVKPTIRSAPIQNEMMNYAPCSTAPGYSRTPSLWSTSSSQQMKNHHYIPISVAQRQKHNAGATSNQTMNHAEPLEIEQRARGLKRTLSKVKSLTEIHHFPVQGLRGHTSRVFEGDVDRSSYAVATLHAPAVEAPASCEAVNRQAKRESGLSSFIKRKLSADALWSPYHPVDQKGSPSVAAEPVISSPLLAETPWFHQDSAFIQDAEFPYNQDKLSNIGSPIQLFSPRNQTDGSPLDDPVIIYHTSPKLPEIREERENVNASDRNNASLIVQNTGLDSTSLSGGFSETKEPIFKAFSRLR